MTYDGGARPYVCTSRESMMIALCTRDVIIAAIQSKKPNSKGEATLLEAMRKECSFIVEVSIFMQPMIKHDLFHRKRSRARSTIRIRYFDWSWSCNMTFTK